MSEDHIKTVVIDPPMEYRADDESSDDASNECTKTVVENENPQEPPYRSWLS